MRRQHIPRKAMDPLEKESEPRPCFKDAVFKRGDRELTKLPWVPKGSLPWSEPKTVTDVLGTYTFLLSDGYVWNTRRMNKWIRIRPPMEVQMPDDDTPAPAHRTLRRSRRTRRTPERYGFENL